jgi:hypothetical protein
MATKTIGIAVALILLGVAGYAFSGFVSITALIPAFFGVVLLALGILARDDKKRKMAMHIAAAVGLLGFLGSMRGLMKLPALLQGEPLERPVAVLAQSIMALFTAFFVGLCVKSFIDARRSRP